MATAGSNRGVSSGASLLCFGVLGTAIAIVVSVWYPIQMLAIEIRELAVKEQHIVAPAQQTPAQQISRPRDCYDVQGRGQTTSGVYTIYPSDIRRGIPVFCDLDTDDGRWTVFQRRVDGSEEFTLKWDAYQFGFGKLEGEFWLGNEYIHLITKQGMYELRIDLEDFENNWTFAKYKLFSVANRNDNFRLTVAGYTGTAGDSFSSHNGVEFSTIDNDNDQSSGSCAQAYKGGWWYSNCLSACLNGKYLAGNHTTNADGINWFDWKGLKYSLKSTRMMMRPR